MDNIGCHTRQPYLVCARGQTHHLSLLTDTNTKRHGVLRKRLRQLERSSHVASQALRGLRPRRRQLSRASRTPPVTRVEDRQWSGCPTLLHRRAPHPRPHDRGRAPRGSTLRRVSDGAAALEAVGARSSRSSTSRRTTSSLKWQGQGGQPPIRHRSLFNCHRARLF